MTFEQLSSAFSHRSEKCFPLDKDHTRHAILADLHLIINTTIKVAFNALASGSLTVIPFFSKQYTTYRKGRFLFMLVFVVLCLLLF